MVIAPWFLAPGRLPDRVRTFADGAGIEMAAPLGAHRLVAETVLDRFEHALKAGAERVEDPDDLLTATRTHVRILPRPTDRKLLKPKWRK